MKIEVLLYDYKKNEMEKNIKAKTIAEARSILVDINRELFEDGFVKTFTTRGRKVTFIRISEDLPETGYNCVVAQEAYWEEEK